MAPRPAAPTLEDYCNYIIEGRTIEKGKRRNYAVLTREFKHRYAKGDIIFLDTSQSGAPAGPFRILELSPHRSHLGPPRYVVQSSLLNGEGMIVPETMILRKYEDGNPVP